LHSYEYIVDGVPVVPTEAIRNRQIDLSVCPRISFEKASELRRHSLEEGDILFARRGIQATGHIGVIREKEAGFICGTGAIRLRIEKGNSIVSADYLSHLLADQASIAWFKFHAIGATMPNLNEGIIKSFPLALPPVDEQRAVADTLSALDDKIELNRRMNHTLEAMAEAIFKDWFVDFGPVRRKLAGATDPIVIMGGVTSVRDRAAEFVTLFPDNLCEEGMPEGWAETPFSNLVEIIGGGTPKTSEPSYWDGDIPWFSVADTPSGSDTFVFATEKSITTQGMLGSSARLIPPGTTIITARGTVGNLAIAGREMTFNQSCYALKSAEGSHPYFVYLATGQTVERLKSVAHGSVFSTITRQTFDSVNFVAPSIEARETFEKIATPLYKRISAAVEENRTLAETRDYLLPRLISGKVRMRNAEKMMD
jgi:type I restriction enzyme S subunit